MSKLGLAVLCLSMLASAKLAEKLQGSNYDVLQNFTISFMTAYEGKSYNASQDCFSNAATSKLDSDIVAIMKSLAFGQIADMDIYVNTLLADLQSNFQLCRITDLSLSFHNNLKMHGYDFFVGNAFWRALDIYACAGRAVVDIVKGNYASVGIEFGTMAKYLNPPLLVASKAKLMQTSHNFVAGLAAGLERTPGSSDPCYADLSALGTNESQFVSDLLSLLNGNVAATFALVADVKNIIAALDSSAPACNLSELGQFFESLLSQQGITQAAVNLSNNVGAIKEASAVFATCTQDFYQCGYSTGEVFRLISGWGI